MKTLKLLTLLAFVFFIAACGDDPQPTGCETDFDQEAMFTNIADNLIIPAYTDLYQKTRNLDIEGAEFHTLRDEQALQEFRQAFLDTYLCWQRVSQYEFGPAEEQFLLQYFNNFPLDTAALHENMQNGTFNFNNPDTYDKGLPALDYLLFGYKETDADFINAYNNEQNLRIAISKIIFGLRDKAEIVHGKWLNTYRATFVTNTGTAAGSSLSLIVNSFNQNYEYIKRDKLGIPSGVLTLGFTNPTKVEAYYSGYSVELANAALNASFDYYKGKNGLGLDDYLQKIGTMKGDKMLDAVIQEQFETAISAVANLQNPLSETVENNPQTVVNAYNEVTKQLINIKTDMPSVLCVSITYIDNPSDSD